MFSYEKVENLGWAYLNSLIIYLKYNGETYETAIELLTGEKMKHSSNIYINFEYIKKNKNRIKLIPEKILRKYIHAMCATHHENAHIRQASSSTICLWLALHQSEMYTNLYFFLQEISKKSIKTIHYPIKFHLQELANKLTPGEFNFPAYFLLFDQEYGAITGKDVYTMDKLLKIVNKNSIRYKTKLIDSELSTPNGLNLSHLLEGQARLADYDVLSYWKEGEVSQELLEEIISSLNIEGYVEAWIFFLYNMIQRQDLSTLQIGALYRIALHLALFPNLIYKNTIPEEMYWEDLQPCWRFYLIIERLKIIKIPENPLLENETLIQDICNHYKWKTPLDQSFETSEINKDLIKDIFEKELMNRHITYSKMYQNLNYRTGLIFNNKFNDLNVDTIFEPWLKCDGEGLGFYIIKEESEKIKVFSKCLSLFILQELLYKNNFDFSYNIFRHSQLHFINSNEISNKIIQEEYKNFFEQITHHPFETMESD